MHDLDKNAQIKYKIFCIFLEKKLWPKQFHDKIFLVVFSEVGTWRDVWVCNKLKVYMHYDSINYSRDHLDLYSTLIWPSSDLVLGDQGLCMCRTFSILKSAIFFFTSFDFVFWRMQKLTYYYIMHVVCIMVQHISYIKINTLCRLYLVCFVLVIFF